MTGNLSQAPEKMLPDVCPKCGHPTRAQTIERHFRETHPGAIGTAIHRRHPDFARDFVYLGPVPGTSEWWHIVWLEFPAQVVRLHVGGFLIKWAGPVPAEGARG